MAHYITRAKYANQDDTRPQNEPQKTPREFLLIVPGFSRKNS